MKRIRSPLLLAAMALLAAGLTLWGSADRSFAGQTDQGYGAGGEARELDKEAQESMFSYQVEGEPESPYGEGSQELERLLEALGMEVPTLLPEEAAGMEKVVDPPMNFLVSKTEGLLDYTLPDGSRFSASVPQGMTVTDPVTFKPVENAILTILRNGSGIETSRDGIYSQPGKYHICLLYTSDAADDGDSTHFFRGRKQTFGGKLPVYHPAPGGVFAESAEGPGGLCHREDGTGRKGYFTR